MRVLWVVNHEHADGWPPFFFSFWVLGGSHFCRQHCQLLGSNEGFDFDLYINSTGAKAKRRGKRSVFFLPDPMEMGDRETWDQIDAFVHLLMGHKCSSHSSSSPPLRRRIEDSTPTNDAGLNPAHLYELVPSVSSHESTKVP